MKKLTLRSVAILFVLNVFFVGASFARQTISPEKKALIQEVLKLTKISEFRVDFKLGSTNVLEKFLATFEKDSQLSDADKTQLKKFAFEANMRIETHINNFNEDKKNSSELLAEIGTGLFDKAFTEPELKEMVAFYRTPTGQKNATFLMNFMSDLSKQNKEIYNKRLNALLQEK